MEGGWTTTGRTESRHLRLSAHYLTRSSDLRKGDGQGSMGRCAHRPRRFRHPERRRRSRRSRRTSPVASACSGGGIPGLGDALRPPEARRRTRAPRRLRCRLFNEIATRRNLGTQGSMGRYAHRPCCPWFELQRVRLTKPPQIAGTRRLWARRGRRDGAPAAAADLRRLVQVSCGWQRVGSATDLRAPAGARAESGHAGASGRSPRGRSPGCSASGCTFFEVRCRRVGEGRVRAHFLRFVAAKGAPAARGECSLRRVHCKSAGQGNDEHTGHNWKRARTARKGRSGRARVQRTSKNVHETRFRRRATTGGRVGEVRTSRLAPLFGH